MVLARPGGASVTVRGYPRSYQPHELVGGLMQGDQRVEILVEEIEAASWPAPPVKPDRLSLDGGDAMVMAATPVCEGETVIGYSLWVR